MGYKGVSLAEMQIVPSCTSILESNAVFRIKTKIMNHNNRYDIALNRASLLVGSLTMSMGSLTMFHHHRSWQWLALVTISRFYSSFCPEVPGWFLQNTQALFFQCAEKGRHARAQQQHQLWQEVLAKAEMTNPGSSLLPCLSTPNLSNSDSKPNAKRLSISNFQTFLKSNQQTTAQLLHLYNTLNVLWFSSEYLFLHCFLRDDQGSHKWTVCTALCQSCSPLPPYLLNLLTNFNQIWDRGSKFLKILSCYK